MLGSMGGHGINTRRVPSVSLLLNGKSFTTYFYSKPKRDLLLSRKKNLLPCLKLEVGRNFQDTDSCCMAYTLSSLGMHTPFLFGCASLLCFYLSKTNCFSLCSHLVLCYVSNNKLCTCIYSLPP